MKGFYYHYKHTDEDMANYAYEVLGISLDTEEGTESVIYRPLYEDSYLDSRDFYARPKEMFFEKVEDTQRFTQITDPAVLEELIKIRDAKYS
ncbi:DUF1653 domain-containing protein [Candidatus Kaiserbacteria bacterium]|nr:DUF1653 domain-containing protein [Candidatus Kaiserbacteria bacterium]